MSSLLYWMQMIVIRSLINLQHAALAIFYWNKNRSVPPIKNPLLLKSAKNLSEDIRNGKLKSKDLILAYIDRIQEVEPYLNAVVEDRFEEAVKEAAEVDELIQSRIFSKQRLEEDKPLLGIPFTVKHALKVKGCRCTAGSKFYKDFVAEEDAASVTLLKNAGGIVLATTNIPEFCIQFETNNLINGRTCNPYNTSRTPGGSSGGECALVAAGASIIGIGNDLLGSLRIPAQFSGVFAHKATKGLVPSEGIFPTLPEELENFVSSGPICRFSEDLVIMMKILTADNDQNVKFDKKFDFKKLKIFYWTSIKDPRVVPVDKDIMEKIDKAICHFTESYGVSAQELNLPIIRKTNDVVTHLFPAPIENFAEFFTGGKMKDYNTFSELFKQFFGSAHFCSGTLLAFSIFNCPLIVNRQHIPYYREILKQLTEELDNLLDYNSVIICPTFPTTATYHSEVLSLLVLSSCYISLCNLTGMPGTAVPMGLSHNGMPLGIQIIGKKNNDPLTIACVEELSRVFGGWIPPGMEQDKDLELDSVYEV